jgi:hypothetical protein
LNELSRLAKMSESQCHAWFQRMAEILTHNFEKLRENDFDERFRLWANYLEPVDGSTFKGERRPECDARSDI